VLLGREGVHFTEAVLEIPDIADALGVQELDSQILDIGVALHVGRAGLLSRIPPVG
jgi:hypothetical protein